LEASDHLIRITQYMAEVITELEHSSSSSGNDEGDSFESNELEMKDAGEADQKDSGVDDETLQRIVQETALLREEYEKRKAQKRNIPTNMEEDSVVFTTWILPILIAIIVAWLWRSRQAVEVGNHL
jgi:ATP-dependent Zn protease